MSENYFTEYVMINGINQFFLHIPNSNNEVMIMLHGGPGAPNSYIAYYHQPYLNFCNVVYYDQRGAGKTRLKNKDKTTSLEVMLEDLKQTIQYIKNKYKTDRVVLAGHSWGTMLGTQYIIKYPNDVIGYIGYGQCVDSELADRSWYEYLKNAVLKSKNKRDIKKINAVNDSYPNIDRRKYFRDTILLSRLDFKYGYKANDFTKIYRKSPIMTLRDGIQMLNSVNNNKNLIKDVLYDYSILDIVEYKLPIYYILGRHDELASGALAEKYFQTIIAPKKDLYWIEDAGHMLETDNPSSLFKTVHKIISAL